MELVKYEAMHQAIIQAHSVDEVKDIRDRAEALRLYAKQSKQGIDDINRVTEIKLRAERRAGEMLRELPKDTGGKHHHKSYSPQPGENKIKPLTKDKAIADAGISKGSADRWQQIADIPEPEFERFIAETKEAGEELTTAKALSVAKGKPHVSNNSGNNEWYTPKEFIEAARATMGRIDLDPASSETANSVVSAATFYAAENNGLEQEWVGNVWMNPPYSGDLIGLFCSRLAESWDNNTVNQAVVLVNNATETEWFNVLVERASAVCFPSSRVKFWKPDGETGAPLQGQAIIYMGLNADRFAENFKEAGWIARL